MELFTFWVHGVCGWMNRLQKYKTVINRSEKATIKYMSGVGNLGRPKLQCVVSNWTIICLHVTTNYSFHPCNLELCESKCSPKRGSQKYYKLNFQTQVCKFSCTVTEDIFTEDGTFETQGYLLGGTFGGTDGRRTMVSRFCSILK